MLRHFISKVHNRRRMARPRVVVAVPSGITEVEKRAVKDSATHAGAREVYLIEEPMAAAIGVGLPVQDAAGNLAESFSGPVSIALPALVDATLSGTTTVNAVAGQATFSDLSLDVVGAYALIATSGALAPDTTAAITVAAAAAARLEFTTAPGAATAGSTLAPATTVRALDAFGNEATGFVGPVSLTLLDGKIGRAHV